MVGRFGISPAKRRAMIAITRRATIRKARITRAAIIARKRIARR